jgi:hypothetical protein
LTALTDDGTCWSGPVWAASAARTASSSTPAVDVVVRTSPSRSSVTVVCPNRMVAS